MKVLIIFLLVLVSIVFISGCATVPTGKVVGTSNGISVKLTKPMFPTVQPKIEDKVETEVISAGSNNDTGEYNTVQIAVAEGVGIKEGVPSENRNMEPRIFQVNVVEGIGVEQSA